MHAAEARAYLQRIGARYGDVTWSRLVDEMAHPVWGTTLIHRQLWQCTHNDERIRVTQTPTGEAAFRLLDPVAA
jgi:hypothetical protein